MKHIDDVTLRNSDLLIWHATSVWGWLIERLSGPGCHAAKVVICSGIPFAVETMEGVGGTLTPLYQQVKRYPGKIDLYRTNPGNRWEYDREGATAWSLKHVPGTPYGWWPTIRAGLTRAIGIRWFLRPDRRDAVNGTKPPNCSAACSMADRIGGGVDPVPHLSDYSTTPGDLARSMFYEYVCTLA